MNIVSRSGWGARPPESRTTISTPVPRLWLHHTGSTTDNGAQTVRAIQAFHQGPSRRWADIGYSWLYSPRYRMFYVGRGPGVAGAHTKGDNSRSHALAVLGDFDMQAVPAHVVEDLRVFLRWHTKYGPGRFTGGHRDAPGASTSCPGRNLHRLIPTINALEEQMAYLSDDAQKFWQRAYDELQQTLNAEGGVEPARPSSLRYAVQWLRGVRDVFSYPS